MNDNELKRIADALERIADALESAHPKTEKQTKTGPDPSRDAHRSRTKRRSLPPDPPDTIRTDPPEHVSPSDVVDSVPPVSG